MSAAQPSSAKRPVRVVSLLPSATEMLFLLGAEIVGRSHECDWPPAVRDRVPALTGAHNKFENSAQMHDAVTESLSSGRGLYWLDAERLAELRPDAIVTQSLCSVCAVDLDIVRRAVSKTFPQPRIIDTKPMSLHNVIDDVRRLGRELGLAQRGEEAAAALQARVDRAVALAAELAAAAPPPRPKRVVFLEWTSPLFPGGHWTPQMIHMAGGVCPVNPPRDGGAGGAAPSKETDPAEVVGADPDLIIVAPCGLDLETTRREVAVLDEADWWRGLRAVQAGRVVLVDGNQHFNRPGPRLVDALEWLVALLADRIDLMNAEFPWEWLRPEGKAQATEAMPPQAEEQAPVVTAAGSTIGLTPPPSRSPSAVAPSAATGPLLRSDSSSTQERLRPMSNGASYSGLNAGSAAVTQVTHGSATAAAAAAELSTPSTPRRAVTTTADGHLGSTGGAAVGAVGAGAAVSEGRRSGGGQACCCGGGGGAVAAADPWVVTLSPWSGAPHLPPDIEDLHAAACESGKSSYDDPETGFMVFTAVGLAKRGQCCANRCRHCPWGHSRVAGRPRLNRITRPALLHPSPAAQRAWRQQRQRQQLEQKAWHQQQQQLLLQAQGRGQQPSELGGSVGGAGVLGTLGPSVVGGGCGPTLFCHEGCQASDELLAALVAKYKAECSSRSMGAPGAEQRVALLVAFDVDSGALWGRNGGGGAAAAPATATASGSGADAMRGCCNGDGHRSSRGGGNGGSCNGDGTRSGSSNSNSQGYGVFDAVHLSAVMDASLRHDLDLVVVPLQVRDTCWPHDPARAQHVLSYVLRTAAQLLGASSVGHVIGVRQEGGTPDLFVQGMTAAVPVLVGWSEIVRHVNAELALGTA